MALTTKLLFSGETAILQSFLRHLETLAATLSKVTWREQEPTLNVYMIEPDEGYTVAVQVTSSFGVDQERSFLLQLNTENSDLGATDIEVAINYEGDLEQRTSFTVETDLAELGVEAGFQLALFAQKYFAGADALNELSHLQTVLQQALKELAKTISM